MKVYYAGKIAKNDWRHTLYPNLRNFNPDFDFEIKHKRYSFLNYSGPFFISCDHGCYHGKNTHGVGRDRETCEYMESIKKVSNKCLNLIKESDAIFCFIESIDCYGTLVEIGYAKALRKPIFIALDNNLKANDYKEIWFALESADKVIKTSDIIDAHFKFLSFIYESGCK